MERTPVTSTMIRAVGYDAETKSLEIEFNKGGAIWLYSEVPAEEHDALMKADSLGKYFLSRIKDKYPATKQ